ncbi:MAG: hypothetical protein WBP45_02455, partial [Daejeonella sp.]
DLLSVKSNDLSCIVHLHQLKSFYTSSKKNPIDLSVLKKMKSIQELCIVYHLSLNSIDFISDMTGLEDLKLFLIPNLRSLPSFKKLKHLRSIQIDELKNLEDVSQLQTCINLEYLQMNHHGCKPEAFYFLPHLKKLKKAYVYFKKKKYEIAFRDFLVLNKMATFN